MLPYLNRHFNTDSNPDQKSTKNQILLRTLLRKNFLAVILMFTLTGCIFYSQSSSEDVKWLIKVLDLKEGSVVADIGAGDGDEALAVAEHVGQSGKVYSTELGENSVEKLREAVEDSGTKNMTVLEGHPAKTNLPQECCDAIYLRQVYHHIEDPSSINTSLLQSLKPGGRLAIIDFPPIGSEEQPENRTSGSSHGVTADTVIEELRQAGFELVNHDDKLGRNYYVVMQKPADQR